MPVSYTQQPQSLPSGPQFWGLPLRKIRGYVLQLSIVLTAMLAGQWLEKTTGIHSFLFRFAVTMGAGVLELFGILAIVWLVQSLKKG